MPDFVVIAKHTVESCPLFNEEIKGKFKEAVVKREEVAKKHGIKVIGAWTEILDHLIIYVVEASGQWAVEDWFREIGFAFWNTVEIRQVRLVEDVLKKL
jgi:hypothetical protein